MSSRPPLNLRPLNTPKLSARTLIVGWILLLMVVVVLGLYGWHLKSRADELSRQTDQRPVPVPVSGPPQRVLFVVAYDDDAALRTESVELPLPKERQARSLEILRGLLSRYASKPSPHPMPDNAEIRDLFLAAGGTAVVNTNAAFADAHRSSVLGEDLTVLSLVATLAANEPTVLQVKFLVEGKERDTLAGHADLRHFLDVQRVQEAVRDFTVQP